jgi:hypothetical protein
VGGSHPLGKSLEVGRRQKSIRVPFGHVKLEISIDTQIKMKEGVVSVELKFREGAHVEA